MGSGDTVWFLQAVRAALATDRMGMPGDGCNARDVVNVDAAQALREMAVRRERGVEIVTRCRRS